jgi:hypothetical protein
MSHRKKRDTITFSHVNITCNIINSDGKKDVSSCISDIKNEVIKSLTSNDKKNRASKKDKKGKKKNSKKHKSHKRKESLKKEIIEGQETLENEHVKTHTSTTEHVLESEEKEDVNPDISNNHVSDDLRSSDIMSDNLDIEWLDTTTDYDIEMISDTFSTDYNSFNFVMRNKDLRSVLFSDNSSRENCNKNSEEFEMAYKESLFKSEWISIFNIEHESVYGKLSTDQLELIKFIFLNFIICNKIKPKNDVDIEIERANIVQICTTLFPVLIPHVNKIKEQLINLLQ